MPITARAPGAGVLFPEPDDACVGAAVGCVVVPGSVVGVTDGEAARNTIWFHFEVLVYALISGFW